MSKGKNDKPSLNNPKERNAPVYRNYALQCKNYSHLRKSSKCDKTKCCSMDSNLIYFAKRSSVRRVPTSPPRPLS